MGISGFKLTFKGKTQASFNNKLITEAYKNSNNLYIVQVVKSSQIFVSCDDWTTWHKRLGHLNSNYMSKLLPITKPTFCEGCALAKSKKLPHKGKTRDQVAQDNENKTYDGTIHSDLMGPIRQQSFLPAKYVLTYLCAQTEYSYVYLLSSKSEQIDKFREFKTMYENNSNRKIKVLTTDIGIVTESLSYYFKI